MPDEFAEFSSTRWSLVARAGALDSRQRAQALDELLRRYLPSLRAHLVLRKRLPRDRADDVLQEFIVRKVLEKELIASASPTKGKFRTLLLTALDRFLIDLSRQREAKVIRQSLDVDGFDEPPAVGAEAVDVFELAWAQNVVGEAIREMRDVCGRSQQAIIWDVFQARLLQPAISGTPPVSYEVLATRLGFNSSKGAANAIVTAKRKFDQVVRGVVAAYITNDADIDAELASLRRTLASPGAFDPREVARCLEPPESADDSHISLTDAAPDKLAHLLHPLNDASPIWSSDDYRQLLEECYRLPLNEVLSVAGDEVGTVGGLLNRPQPALGQLSTLQRVAKQCRRQETGVFPSRIAELIYFASIAVSIVRCGEKSSRLDDAALLTGIEIQLACDWLDEPLRELLESAAARLRQPTAP